MQLSEKIICRIVLMIGRLGEIFRETEGYRGMEDRER